MYKISKLLGQSSKNVNWRSSVEGVCVWALGGDEVTQTFAQTFGDHGGVRVGAAEGQSAWFFFDHEGFKALARLQQWLRLNPHASLLRVMPARLCIDPDAELALDLPDNLSEQQAEVLEGVPVQVHPALSEAVGALHGLQARPPVSGGEGESNGIGWLLLGADPSLGYEPELSWYFLVRPIGKRLEYAQAWRHFFSLMDPTLQRLGIKYIFNDANLILALSTARQLRQLCMDIMRHQQTPDADGREPWPLVMVALSRQGLHFNEDLPDKLKLNWDALTPNCPHMSLRDGLLLGDKFRIGAGVPPLTAVCHGQWCFAALCDAESVGSGAYMSLPPEMVTGAAEECFYCGLKSHEAAQCPSKVLEDPSQDVWERLAMLPMDRLRKVAQDLGRGDGGEMLSLDALLGRDDTRGLLGMALMDVCRPFQLRMLGLVWRSRSKEWAGAFDQLAPEEGEFIWTAMRKVQAGDLDLAAEELKQAARRYPRSYQPRSLSGFVSMEQGDWPQALYYFQESSRLCFSTVQQVFFTILRGRLHEVTGELDKALSMYREAEQLSRGWSETIYRQGVCQVKQGFVTQGLATIRVLVDRDPHFFTRLLFDPQLARGQQQVRSMSGEMWREAQAAHAKAKEELETLERKLGEWFGSEHPFSLRARQSILRLNALAEVENYVCIQRLVQGCAELKEQFDEQVDAEVERLTKRVDVYYERLKTIMREASWFPFPTLLRDFSREFNACSDKLGWLMTQYLKNAENFKTALTSLVEVEMYMTSLQKRLTTLRIMRDGAFFLLLLGRSYIWMQLLGLALALVVFPCLIYFTEGGGWLSGLISGQKWHLQKVMLVVMSVLAMAAAGLKTGLGFEAKKNAFFEQQYQKTREAPTRRKAAVRPNVS